MRRGSVLALVLLACVCLTEAQPQGVRPGPARRRPPGPQVYKPVKLTGVDELRFIASRLELDEKQAQHVEGLIEEYEAIQSAPVEEGSMGQIADLLQQLAAARQEGDKDKEAALQQQLNDARPGVKARGDFLAGLRLVLSDKQKADLDAVLKFLETNPSGKVRPFDVYMLALELNLTAEQKKALDGVHHDFLVNRIQKIADKSTVPDVIADDFLVAVEKLLDDSQRAEFRQRLGAIVPNFSGLEQQPQKPTPE